MLSRIFSFTNTSNISNIGLTRNVQNIANIRAVSHFSNATFSYLRTSNPIQNTRLPGNLHTTSRTIHTQSISAILHDTFSSLFLSGKQTQEKIEKAIKIQQSGKEVFMDKFQIEARSDGPIKLYTTGLVYCTGILMMGKDKVALAHIHGKGIEFMKDMFDATQPHKLIIYASSGVSEHSSGMGFYAEMMKNLDSLRAYVKQSGIHCEIINLDYSTQITPHGPGLFYTNDGEEDFFFTMKSKEMKKLNQTL